MRRQVDRPNPRPKLRLRVAHRGRHYHVSPSGDVPVPRPHQTVVPIAERGRGSSHVLEDLRLGVKGRDLPAAYHRLIPHMSTEGGRTVHVVTKLMAALVVKAR